MTRAERASDIREEEETPTAGLRRQIATLSRVANATQATYGSISNAATWSTARKASMVTRTATSSTTMVATAEAIFCRPKNTAVQPRLIASCSANSVNGPRVVSQSALRHTRQAATPIRM